MRYKRYNATWLSVIYLGLMAALLAVLVHPSWMSLCSDLAHCRWLSLIEWSIIILGIIASQLFWIEATRKDEDQ